MSNHPNRGPKGPQANPTIDEIFGCRMNARLTQAAAAALIYAGVRTWQQWEAGDRRMHPGLFELFMLKTGQIKLWETIPWETLPEIIQAKADVRRRLSTPSATTESA